MFLKNIKNYLSGALNLNDNRIKILDCIYGSAASIEKMTPVDAKGKPLPWFTYPAIEYFERLDFSQSSFFEFGSGMGTIYWSKVCKDITSVEDNLDWYERVKLKVKRKKNVELSYAGNREDYVNRILKTKKKFDVIIVDGVHRDGCTHNAIKSLKDGGMIILDNSDWYANSAKILRGAGYTQIDFDGFGPGNRYTWVTSIFFKSIKFKHTENINKNFSKGGNKEVVHSE